MRRALVGLLALAVGMLGAPAEHAAAQYWPGPLPNPGYGPGAATATITATAVDPVTACNQAVAQAAAPIANQMLYFTAAANLYPMTPNLRPVLGPAPLYPGFAAIYGGPGLSLGLANAALASTLGGLAAFPGGTAPAAILTQLSTTPPGLVAPGGIGTPQSVDLLTIAALQQAQVANVLGALGTQQSVVGTRLAAAELNAAFTAWPREQAALLKEVLEGLTFYRDLVCGASGGTTAPAPAANGNGGTNRSTDTERP